MKLPDNPFLTQPGPDFDRRLTRDMQKLLRDIHLKVNQLASGSIGGVDGAVTSAPTTGNWAQGDFVRHAAPVEAGTPGQQYVLFGWICIAGGSPGTWREARFMTGN